MNPGALDRQISLFAPVQTTDAVSGGAVTTFRNAGVIWGKRVDQGGREYRALGALNAETTAVFTIRYHPEITTRWRMTSEGYDYDITDIGETGNKRRELLAVQAKIRLP